MKLNRKNLSNATIIIFMGFLLFGVPLALAEVSSCSECDNRFINWDGGDNITGNLTIIGNLTVGDGGLTNYINFDDEGKLTLHGTSKVMREVDMNLKILKKSPTSPPEEINFDGFEAFAFNRDNEESLYGRFILNNDYSDSGNVSIVFHFLVQNPPSGTGNEAVVWGVEYKNIDEGDIVDFETGTASNTVTETIVDGETSETLHICKVSLTTTGWTSGETILMKFYRDSTNADDTYDNEASANDNDAILGILEVNYLADKLGEEI